MYFILFIVGLITLRLLTLTLSAILISQGFSCLLPGWLTMLGEFSVVVVMAAWVVGAVKLGSSTSGLGCYSSLVGGGDGWLGS